MTQKIKSNYHWLIAVLVFIEMIIFGGIINSFSVYTIPISESLGVSRGVFALAGTPYGVVSFLSSTVTVVLFNRVGYRKLAFFSLITSVCGLVLMSFSENLWVYSISRALFGIGYGAGFTAGSVWIIRQWFQKHVGLVLGLVSMASGIGGSIMTLLLSNQIVTFGWRTAARTSALLLLPITFAILIFVRDNPKELNLLPLSDTQKVTKKIRRESDWPGLPADTYYRRPLFYMMCFATLTSCICLYMTSFVIVPHFRDNGYSPTAASRYDSVYMLCLAFAKLALGWFSDRFGAKPLAAICLSCTAIGQLILSDVSNPFLSYVGVILFSVGLCMSSISIPLISMPLFGYDSSIQLNSIFISMTSLGSIIAIPLSNLVYDRIGSYSPGFTVAAVISLGLIAVYMIMFAIAKKDRAEYLKKAPLK